MVLACQIAMESCMFGFNELESILVNREDEKYHVQMEGQALELILSENIIELQFTDNQILINI